MSEKKQEAKPQPDKPTTKAIPFEVIREGTAPKLRDKKQTIHYAIGKHDNVDGIRLISNTGKGLFSSEPIPLTAIQQCLSNLETTVEFTSRLFHPLFSKLSNNNAGFIASVLRQEGVLKPVDGKLFKHQLVIKPDMIVKHLLATTPPPKATTK
ncbi:hypothetical protein L4D77_20340 [Photobacterium frigidiphilum]|uniref:hypothetical protein n=1 Tax=Photobacterium frigidiphilum TaxID=264736 RepID=UPI003D11314B